MHAVPPRLLAKLRGICLALPDAYEEEAWLGTRWMIRKKNFAHALTIAGGKPAVYARAAGRDGTVLTFRAPAELADTLRSHGEPYFVAEWGTRWGAQVIGVRLERPRWKEIAMLVGESYRTLAAKRR
jgi:hypothetical protein